MMGSGEVVYARVVAIAVYLKLSLYLQFVVI